MNSNAWIQTFTGRKFFPLDPDPEMICIEDIAHSLSLQCRFSGHSRRMYSVAEHSIALSRELVDRNLALEALLHDASEAYLSDIPSPLKRLPEFAFYRNAEDTLQALIYTKFGLPATPSRTVKLMDKMILRNEALSPAIMNPTHPDWQLPSVGLREDLMIGGMKPEVAEATFLSRFRELFYKGNTYETDFIQSREEPPAETPRDGEIPHRQAATAGSPGRFRSHSIVHPVRFDLV